MIPAALLYRGARFLVLDGAARIGESWRRRWDSLRLFTPARYNALPGKPFPGAPYALPGKDEVAAYLEDYATRFELPIRLNTRASSLGVEGDRFVVATDANGTLAKPIIDTPLQYRAAMTSALT